MFSNQGRQTGGGSQPHEFWKGGLNACQPPPPRFCENVLLIAGYFYKTALNLSNYIVYVLSST